MHIYKHGDSQLCHHAHYIFVCSNPDACRICTQFLNESLSSCNIVECETNLLTVNEINEEILKLYRLFLFFSNTSKDEDIFQKQNLVKGEFIKIILNAFLLILWLQFFSNRVLKINQQIVTSISSISATFLLENH